MHLGEAADPEVDVVETGDRLVAVVGPGAGAVHEVGGVGGRDASPRSGLTDRRGCRRRPGSAGAVVGVSSPADAVVPTIGRLGGDRRVLAVGGDEVDERLGVLEVLPEVDPVGVRRQLTVVGRGEDLPANVVQRRDALAAGPRHVDGRQVERQAQQVVAERVGDELVELVAGLVRQAHDDAAARPAAAVSVPAVPPS